MDNAPLTKICLCLLFVLSGIFNANGQFLTDVTIIDLPANAPVKNMQTNASQLLTSFNGSYKKGTTPDLSKVSLSDVALSSISSLWETSPFTCLETEIIDKGLVLSSGGYELRNIPIFIKEADSSERNQEIVIVFSREGSIDNVYISIGNHLYKSIISQSNSVTDLRRRGIILDFIENFRTAYNRKDLELLNKVFSEDALIITGKVIKVMEKNGDFAQQNLSKEKIVYQKQTKNEYLAKLKQIFSKNSYINIKFEEIEVVQHGKYPDYYGVTIKQYYNTSSYHDIGYLFLLIDFQEEANPIIHVRTWQPDKIGDRQIATDEIFNLGSFGNLR